MTKQPKTEIYKPTKETKMKTITEEKQAFNWSALRTKVLVAVFALAIGLITGYFLAMNIHEDARASVVSDLQLVKTTSKQ